MARSIVEEIRYPKQIKYLYGQKQNIKQEIENWSHSYNSEKASKKILEVGQYIQDFFQRLEGIVKNDIAEYLLLMTKVKKDLLIKDSKMELQDAVRTGMVVNFLCNQDDDESGHMNFLEQRRDKYINLYCGLYVSKNKLKNKGYKEKLIQEAEQWFEQGKKKEQKLINVFLNKILNGYISFKIRKETNKN